MQRRTVFRRIDGILLLDKPSGMSSNQALQRVRHLFRAEKAGHTGSLDPLATGLLPVCFGEATKIAGLLLGARKAYETVARLGQTTDTDDADGAVLRERCVPSLSDDAITRALVPLTGRIRQRAPIYSALKQGGERLYAMARRGEAVEAPERDVDVLSLRLLGREGDLLRLHVECGSGTYVRSIVRDLGESLGCGAHVVELRRLWVEPFTAPGMVTLEALQHEAAADEGLLVRRLLPIEAGLQQFARIDLDAGQARRFAHGQALPLAGMQESPGGCDRLSPVVVADAVAGRLLGLANVEDGMLRPQRLFAWAGANDGPPAV